MEAKIKGYLSLNLRSLVTVCTVLRRHAHGDGDHTTHALRQMRFLRGLINIAISSW